MSTSIYLWTSAIFLNINTLCAWHIYVHRCTLMTVEDTMINQTEAQKTIQANEVQHLTESELMDVLECARKTSRRDHSLILTMYWHGLRNQEVARLRLSDIDFASCLLTVQRQKSSLKTT